MDPKAYKEVFVIINEMSESLKNKIPDEVIKSIEQKMDKNYVFSLCSNIEDTKLLNDTEKILSVIYTDYIASEEEKLIINAKEKSLFLKSEEEKKKKYGVDVFKRK